jgi:hypothetical protein
VLGVLVVAALFHLPFLECEMGRNARKDLAEEGPDIRFPGVLGQTPVELVQERDHLLMLVVDRLDADTKALLPFDQGHQFRSRAPAGCCRRILTPLASGAE